MNPIRTGWRARRTVLLAATVLAGLGVSCGKNRVLLDVDVRSFMDAADLQNDYSAPPLVPFELDIDPVEINLVDGFQDFGAAETVSLDIGLRFDNTSGAGSGRFDVYFGPDAQTTFQTTAVASIQVNLTSGNVTTGSTRIEADQRLLDLFTSKQLWMGIHLECAPQTAEAMQGTCVISEITAHMVSRLDIF